MKRNSRWLLDRFLLTKSRFFPDLQEKNPIIIKFGRPSKTTLGSIRLKKFSSVWYSVITINRLFTSIKVPQSVVDVTIAHELVHYHHGFSSQARRHYKYPHQGGVVDRELVDRGLGAKLAFQKKWIRENWHGFYRANITHKKKSWKINFLKAGNFRIAKIKIW